MSLMEEELTKKLSIRVWIVCALGLFIDGYDLYISAVAEPFIHAMYHPTPFMVGLTQGSAPVGAALGAIIVGWLSDRIGRKSLLVLNLIFFIGIAIFSACAWDNISLCIFRFLIGFGVGADYPICAAYMSEMTTKNKTRQYIAAAMLINCFASPVGVLVAWCLFKIHPQMDVWRWMFASGAIPAVVALFFRAKLPESFLWKAHQKLKQKTALTENYKLLFSPQLIKTTLCLCFSWFLLDISYYGIGLFTPFVLHSLSVSGQADLLTSANEVLKSTLLINLFIMLGALTSVFFVTKINLFLMQKIGFLFSFFGLLMLSFSFTQLDTLKISLIFSGFILFNFFINFGPGLTTYLLPAEMYKTEIKATGHGLAASFGKLGAFLGTIFLPVLQFHVGIYFTVGIISITLFVGWILTQKLSQENIIEMQWMMQTSAVANKT